MSKDPLIGRQFANYLIESVLGRGGMATVYYARDVSLQRPVALKVIDTQFRHNTSYAERFISEARAIAQWRHENIIQVYYADKEDDLYYFVMEHIDGLDLESVLNQYAEEGTLMPHDDVIRIGKALAGALDYAHRKNVIHRDVKPSNTMIASDDRVVLMDFGLALDTQQGSMGEVFGSPHYVSPEQARRSADAVPQSDVYSLGIVLYEMLTGLVPFDDPAPTALALQHITMPPPSPRSLNPGLNQATEDVLMKALAKEAGDRYQTATEFIDALADALKQVPDKLATAELPPLPPGMVAPKRSLSSRTVTERIAVHVNEKQTVPMPESPRIKQTREQKAIEQTKPPQPQTPPPRTPQPTAPPVIQQKSEPSDNRTMLYAIIGVVVLVIIVGGGLFASGAFSGDDTPLPTEIVLPTNEPQAVVAENTSEPTVTLTMTDAPTSTTVVTDVPTETPVLPTQTTVPPTSTIIPTSTPVPSTNVPAVAEPTVLYPNGRVIQFIWDDDAFYWYNSTTDNLSVSNIDFEALTDSGVSAGFSYDGAEWSPFAFRGEIEDGGCTSLKIITAFVTPPSQCARINSELTPQRDDSRNRVFWITRPGVPEFSVTWNQQEIGRCTISTGLCEVRIP